MPTILALDTSTDACSVALLRNNVITEEFRVAPQQHSNLILLLIGKLLIEAGIEIKDVDAIAFGRGPGSFMGIRLAASVIHGLSLGAELPIISVSSLQALALDGYEKNPAPTILAGWDARMGAIYWNVFSFPENKPLHNDDQLNKPEDVHLDAPLVAAGNAWDVYANEFNSDTKQKIATIIPDCYPRASCVAKLALEKFDNNEFVSLENAVPNYVRDQVAHKKS